MHISLLVFVRVAALACDTPINRGPRVDPRSSLQRRRPRCMPCSSTMHRDAEVIALFGCASRRVNRSHHQPRHHQHTCLLVRCCHLLPTPSVDSLTSHSFPPNCGRDFKMDANSQDKDYQWLPLLPFLDTKHVRAAAAAPSVQAGLSDAECRRNTVGKAAVMGRLEEAQAATATGASPTQVALRRSAGKASFRHVHVGSEYSAADWRRVADSQEWCTLVGCCKNCRVCSRQSGLVGGTLAGWLIFV